MLRREGEERRLYYAQNATLELLEHSGDYISGTFRGTLSFLLTEVELPGAVQGVR